jgi:signal transduction histidine kinase
VRPPLTKRLKLRHWVALDCLVAVPVALVMFATLHRDFSGVAGAPVVAVLALATAVPVALRRLRPLAALTVLLGISVLVQLTVPDNANQFPVFPAVAYVLYLVAAVSSRKVAGLALCASLAFLLVEALLEPPIAVGAGKAAIPLALILVVAWAFGSLMRQRRAYATDLQQQAASQAVAEERLRIARELHDVVAHSMSVIAVQAGFGRYVIDDQPAKAREALGAIQATSRDALDEMRRMLSVLRQPEPGAAAAGQGRGRPYRLRLADLTAEPGGRGPAAAGASSPPADGGTDAQRPPAAPLRPAPGLADLDRLITRVGHAGVHVDLQMSGDRTAVPAGVDLSAFRIIQEALTNVVKHAATPDCQVIVEYGPDELSIEIVDDGRGCALPAGVSGAPGSGAAAVPAGHGLIGMGERVHLCGGQFSAGPLPERGFQVVATLPLSAGPA